MDLHTPLVDLRRFLWECTWKKTFTENLLLTFLPHCAAAEKESCWLGWGVPSSESAPQRAHQEEQVHTNLYTVFFITGSSPFKAEVCVAG